MKLLLEVDDNKLSPSEKKAAIDQIKQQGDEAKETPTLNTEIQDWIAKKEAENDNSDVQNTSEEAKPEKEETKLSKREIKKKQKQDAAQKKKEAEELKKTLNAELPQYMVPQYFVELQKMPHTPNGKIDRKKLPEPNMENRQKNIILPSNVQINSKNIRLSPLRYPMNRTVCTMHAKNEKNRN